MASLISMAAGYFSNDSLTVSLAVSLPDEEIEEEGVKAPVTYMSTNFSELNNIVEGQINKEVQYLHHIIDFPEGFARILYTPPNVA
jgi:hypothetical protein